MPNVLGAYNPVFYANEALIQLEKALGMAGRIHRGYDEERRTFRKGDTITIKRPATFTAQDAPSTAQNLETGTVDIKLNYWKEVKFALTDKELAFTQEKIISDHIRPAAYALADDIDQRLCALGRRVPWYHDLTGTLSDPKLSDVSGPRRVLFDNKVPLVPGMMHYMVDGTLEEILLNHSAFHTVSGAGQAGVETQQRGFLGNKFGVELFANQNVVTQAAGALTATTPLLKGATAKGATQITIDDGTLTGGMVAGDIVTIAGNTQQYVVTADATAAGNEITVNIFPALVQDYADDAAVTIRQDSHTANLMFHRNFAALATAPLSELGGKIGGAKMATITDPKTGLSIRSRLYYDGDESEVNVALDVLYGFEVLDANLACRGCG